MFEDSRFGLDEAAGSAAGLQSVKAEAVKAEAVKAEAVKAEAVKAEAVKAEAAKASAATAGPVRAGAKGPPERRVLVVLHQEQSTPGRIGRLLRENGIRLDIRRPRFGDPLPRTLDAHAGAIVFGGPMSANDEDDWLRREIDWIGVPLAAGKPFLGICLGAQMLARHLGHRVAPHPEGRVEVGYYPVRATRQGRQVWPDLPTKVYQWHREGFDLPCGATLLAEGDDFQAQAFRVGERAFGLQFHPEVTYQMMCRWTTKGSERLAMPGAFPRERHFRDWFLHDAAVARWLDGFLRRWITGEQRSRLGPMAAQPCQRAMPPGARPSVLHA